MRDGLLDELVGAVDEGQGLLQVDDVDAVALGEDEALHLRVPATGLVPEVDAALEQLLHGDDGHGRSSPHPRHEARSSVVARQRVPRALMSVAACRDRGRALNRTEWPTPGREPGRDGHAKSPRRVLRAVYGGGATAPQIGHRPSTPGSRPGCPQDLLSGLPEVARCRSLSAMDLITATLSVAAALTSAVTGRPPPAARPTWAWPSGRSPRPRSSAPTRPRRGTAPGTEASTSPPSPASAVRAALPGRVTVAGAVAGRPVVVVLHRDRLRTTYLPVDPQVEVGDAGVGADRSSGSSRLPRTVPDGCLHWGARDDGRLPRPALPAAVALGRAAARPVKAGYSTGSASRPRSCRTALVCIWQMRLSVTPSTCPISARVSPS